MTRALSLVVLALAACTINPIKVVPLAGETPHTVLVLPVAGGVEPEVARALLVTVEPALRERGYYPLPVDVGIALLAERGMSSHLVLPVDEYAAVARDLGADAFMTVRVERFDAAWADTLQGLVVDLGYRLWDARTHGLLWEHRVTDEWSFRNEPAEYEAADAHQRFLAAAGMKPVASRYRDLVEVCTVLHRGALRALPRR